MEPIGWATQIELIRHGAPHSGVRPDARSSRIERVAPTHTYVLNGMLSHDWRSAALSALAVPAELHICYEFELLEMEVQVNSENLLQGLVIH